MPALQLETKQKLKKKHTDISATDLHADGTAAMAGDRKCRTYQVLGSWNWKHSDGFDPITLVAAAAMN